MVSPGDTIAVWFSCGAASAVAAKKTLEKYGNCATIRIVNNPIKEEDNDNFRFLRDVEAWIEHPIEFAKNENFPSCSVVDVWTKRKYMSGVNGAPCTLELKKNARRQWQKKNPIDWHVLGFTAEERKRHERFVLTEIDNVIPVLIDLNITKRNCFEIIMNAGIKLPRMYRVGYPNGNCPGCVKAESPTYWNHVRVTDPEVFKQRAILSRKLGVKLVKVYGERIFLDELHPKTQGAPMKNMDFECGVFCEEKS